MAAARICDPAHLVLRQPSNIRTVRDFNNAGPPQGRPSQQQYSRYAAQHNEPLQVQEKGISMMSMPPNPAEPIPSLTDRFFPRANRRTFTALMSILQILMFIITLIVGGAKFDGAFVSSNKMAGPSVTTLRYMGGKDTYLIRNNGEVWRLVTPILLHAGILHLLGNMFFQLRFGFVMELRWGIARFAGLYFLTGVGASFWSAVLSPNAVSVGASGALFGVLGCNIAYLWYNWVEIPQRGAEAIMMAFVILFNFLFGLSSEVDNYAHLGGLVTGLFAGLAFTQPLVNRPNEKLIRGGGAAGCAGLFLLFILLLWVGHPGNT